jgi:hypothetical protein
MKENHGRKAARRTALLLGLTALAFYLGIIVMESFR